MLTLSSPCLSLGLRAGAVVLRGVRVGASPAELRAAIAGEAAAVRARFADAPTIRALPEVVAFRELLTRVGVNPKRDQPSVERLLLAMLKKGGLPAINSLVDAYNLVSVRTRCSLGAHDLDAIELPVDLRILTGGESFTALGRTEPQAVTPGEFGYVDARNRVLCRLDVLQADFSKVTATTANALLIVEGTHSHAPAVLRTAMVEASDLITRHCGGTAEVVTWPGDWEVQASATTP